MSGGEGDRSPPVDVHELFARREFLAALVESYYPAHLPVWRSMSGTFTGEQIAMEIRHGTPAGLAYIEGFLTVCRDALARKAQVEQAKLDGQEDPREAKTY